MSNKLFDFSIGNPPYMVEAPGTSTSDKPVYDCFMDSAFQVADKVELITPGRFLFNAGATPSAWNEKMLNDEHFKILSYEEDSSVIFKNTSIVGGIAISYYDSNQAFGKIGTFTQYPVLNQILRKVLSQSNTSLTDIIYTQNKFVLEELNRAIPELNRTDKRLESNIFKLSVFKEEPEREDDIKIIGLDGRSRVIRYINRRFIDMDEKGNIGKYKILLSKSNGASGVLGKAPARMITVPFIAAPYMGYTRTFIGIGAFNTEKEADAALKYIKSKFCRALLGVLKVTQDNNPEKWKYVPIQDFTGKSDIDWSCSIQDIDRQLYRKYSFSVEEIQFIEDHLKELE